jgi:hypothetical protein
VLFASALRDPSPEVWKNALDGLVDLASLQSEAVLQEALALPPPGHTSVAEWTSWLQEALQQVRAALDSQGGVA